MMKNTIMVGLLGAFVASSLNADIYDDYKLLAKAITLNSQKIKELNGLNNEEMQKILQNQNDLQAQISGLASSLEIIKEENADIRKKMSLAFSQKQKSITENTNKVMLDDATRNELLQIIEEK